MLFQIFPSRKASVCPPHNARKCLKVVSISHILISGFSLCPVVVAVIQAIELENWRKKKRKKEIYPKSLLCFSNARSENPRAIVGLFCVVIGGDDDVVGMQYFAPVYPMSQTYASLAPHKIQNPRSVGRKKTTNLIEFFFRFRLDFHFFLSLLSLSIFISVFILISKLGITIINIVYLSLPLLRLFSSFASSSSNLFFPRRLASFLSWCTSNMVFGTRNSPTTSVRYRIALDPIAFEDFLVAFGTFSVR